MRGCDRRPQSLYPVSTSSNIRHCRTVGTDISAKGVSGFEDGPNVSQPLKGHAYDFRSKSCGYL